MKFSVIVPVYNSSKYIKRCIESILSQTFNDWELLIIDDGSIDNSWDIINGYATLDERIKCFRQANAGPGAARNNGIKMANGEYIVFIDSDDYIDCKYFELLEEKAKGEDIVFIDVLRINEHGQIIAKELISKFSRLSKDNILRAQITGKMPWGGVRKVVRAKFLKEFNILYSTLSIGEENLYSFKLLYFSKSYTFLDSMPVYFYIDHLDSQSKLIDKDPYMPVYKILLDYINSTDNYDHFANTLNALNIEATVISIDRITQMFKGKERKKELKLRMQLFIDCFDKKQSIDKKSLMFKAKIFIPFLKARIVWPIVFCSKLRALNK